MAQFRSWRPSFLRRLIWPPEAHTHPQLRDRMNRLEARIAKQAERLARQSERIDKGDKALFARLEELEVGLQEERRLHLRIAELSDLVTGLLAAATQGEEAFRHALESTDLAGGAADVTLAQQ